MDFQIRITEAALADFEEIPATAERFGNAILDHVDLLKSLPPTSGVRQLVHTPILIYYRVNGAPNFVEVLHFWHGSRHDAAF